MKKVIALSAIMTLGLLGAACGETAPANNANMKPANTTSNTASTTTTTTTNSAGTTNSTTTNCFEHVEHLEAGNQRRWQHG
ncbi:MAG: hypothetical protein IPJ30_03060 [Acidobacteria bacterium]|nr:hypothetical protein [Acidobacteriota bacterium]